MKMTINLKHPAIKKANLASSSELRRKANVPEVLEVKGRNYDFRCLHARELPDDLRQQLWAIFEQNMKANYESSISFSWEPEEKKKELFHSLARFLVVLTHDVQVSTEVNDTNRVDAKEALAFCTFRFEREDGRNMLYCYEMQVKKDVLRSGLGKALVTTLEDISRGFGMPRILLTALNANDSALQFYKSMGFEEDITSPSQAQGTDENDEEDYQILSKTVVPSEANIGR